MAKNMHITVFKICDRVHDCLPLYELLNEFQKGHSHIAVVLKSRKGVMKSPEKEARPSIIKLNMNLNSKQRNAVIKGKIKLKYSLLY